MLIAAPDLISRGLILFHLSNEIIYPRMMLAGLGADICIAAIKTVFLIIVSLVSGKRLLLFLLFFVLQIFSSMLAYASYQYAIINLRLIPFKNITNYGGDALRDHLYFKGLMTELFRIDLLYIVVLPLLVSVLLARFWSAWTGSGRRLKLTGLVLLLLLAVTGNGMKWSFDVVRFIGSPIVSHYIYYWVEEPYDRSVLNHKAPEDIDPIRQIFEHGPPTFSRPQLDYQPNIIIVTLESYRANENSVYGGEPGITPNFHDLAPEGTLFTNIFHNGCCTPSGMLAILCSQQPQIEHITVNQTYMPVVCMSDYFHAKGYETAWVNAMGAGSDRFGAFHRFHKVNKIVDGFRFPEDAESLGWSYSDEELIKMANKTLNELKTPFYLHIQTQTSHTPFFIPDGYGIKLHPNDKYNRFLNSLRYVDEHALGFVKKVLKSPVGRRSIIILTADHGIPFMAFRNKKNWDNECKYGHIPLLMIFPEGFDHLPQKVGSLGSQIDIFPTLLDALGEKYPDITAGHSLFAPRDSPRFAYITEGPKEVLITEQFIWKVKPVPSLTTLDNKAYDGKRADFLYWKTRLPLLKQFNLSLIGLKNPEEKGRLIESLFLN